MFRHGHQPTPHKHRATRESWALNLPNISNYTMSHCKTGAESAIPKSDACVSAYDVCVTACDRYMCTQPVESKYSCVGFLGTWLGLPYCRNKGSGYCNTCTVPHAFSSTVPTFLVSNLNLISTRSQTDTKSTLTDTRSNSRETDLSKRVKSYNGSGTVARKYETHFLLYFRN